MFRLIIFEGIDKVGKSEVLELVKSNEENLGRLVVPLHRPDKNFVGFKNLTKLNNIISNFSEKSYFSLPTYVMLFNVIKSMSSCTDTTVIIDRLHLTELSYATKSINRIGSLSDMFTGYSINEYVRSFEETLEELFDEVQMFTFVSNDIDKFEDDNLHPIHKNRREDLVKVNSVYPSIHNLSIIKNKTLITVKNIDGYYTTLQEFSKHYTFI